MPLKTFCKEKSALTRARSTPLTIVGDFISDGNAADGENDEHDCEADDLKAKIGLACMICGGMGCMHVRGGVLA